jgi:thioredoxin 2
VACVAAATRCLIAPEIIKQRQQRFISGCGATNRVPLEKISRGLEPVCGRCKTPLPVRSQPITVTDATFSAEVEQSRMPVLVDMWAAWCGPCQMMAPVLDEIASEMSGRVRVAKLNVDENPVTAARFSVRSIPTLLILKAGQEVDRIVGVHPKTEIKRRLERVLVGEGQSKGPTA